MHYTSVDLCVNSITNFQRTNTLQVVHTLQTIERQGRTAQNQCSCKPLVYPGNNVNLEGGSRFLLSQENILSDNLNAYLFDSYLGSDIIEPLSMLIQTFYFKIFLRTRSYYKTFRGIVIRSVRQREVFIKHKYIVHIFV